MNNIYINRTLNMRKIKAIGFDMDYTLVRYNTENFEELAFFSMIEKLIKNKDYPTEIKSLTFDFKRMIQGLVINKNNGHVLKLSDQGKVKVAYFGTEKIEFREQQNFYGNRELDLNDPNIVSLDTNFSISKGILYGALVQFFKERGDQISFSELANDLQQMLDLCHADGTLKDQVEKDISKYIIKDPELPMLLETYKKYGKKLIIITNSDYKYTKLLMDYTVTPFLKEHDSWRDLFDLTITYSCKPRFFTDRSGFLSIDPDTGLMSNTDEKIEKGLFQGGNAAKLHADLGFRSDEILYLGDHIYGDVVALKKTLNWRTALVFDPLIEEIKSIKAARGIQDAITVEMEEKVKLEKELNELYAKRIENSEEISKEAKNDLYTKIDALNNSISENIGKYQESFNPYWGELTRSGIEETRLAGQIKKYACIYMPMVKDLLRNSPRSYFIPKMRVLPHEE